MKTGQETFTKANILPLAQRPPLQMIFRKNKLIENHINNEIWYK